MNKCDIPNLRPVMCGLSRAPAGVDACAQVEHLDRCHGRSLEFRGKSDVVGEFVMGRAAKMLCEADREIRGEVKRERQGDPCGDCGEGEQGRHAAINLRGRRLDTPLCQTNLIGLMMTTAVPASSTGRRVR